MAANKKAASGNSDKRTSTTKPVADASQLANFWDRGFDLENGYQSVVVEVRGRKDNELTFVVVDSAGVPGKKKFTVNLDDGTQVWSSLPSTAPQADPESSQRVGYLFLTEAWIKRNLGGDRSQLREGGGKWPKNISL